MSTTGLTTGIEQLRIAAQNFFEESHEIAHIHVGSELDGKLKWIPAFRFTINDYINVFVEPTDDSPYPRIFHLRHADVLQFPEPIEVYSVCTEETFLNADNQSEIQSLEDHGYGLLTVNSAGVAKRRFAAVPLIQVIPPAEYKVLLEGLTPKQREKVAQSYDDYKNKPSMGVVSLTETIEGLARQAARDAHKKNWVSKKEAEGAIAGSLDAMFKASQCQNARAAIGGIRNHIANYRNLGHHWPKNKKLARKKYLDCRHAFLDGMRQMVNFRKAMRDLGLSGNLPKV